MGDWLERSELLIGKKEQKRLKKSHVLICGLGGVGSFAGEFIARAGVGEMTIIDGDDFDPTNKNRQLTALDSTIGKNKAQVLGDRIKDINPDIKLTIIKEFVQPERVWEILEEIKPDFVMDCIDSVTPKLNWIKACVRFKIKIISSMGAGGKLDSSAVQVSKLSNTYNCNFASTLKKMLKRENFGTKSVKAVFSSENQIKSSLQLTDGKNFKKSFYGTASYMPALFGLFAAAEVIKVLSKGK
jgi:tRNA A37 threonylcarbamoyladenosine dehydratase